MKLSLALVEVTGTETRKYKLPEGRVCLACLKTSKKAKYVDKSDQVDSGNK